MDSLKEIKGKSILFLTFNSYYFLLKPKNYFKFVINFSFSIKIIDPNESNASNFKKNYIKKSKDIDRSIVNMLI